MTQQSLFDSKKYKVKSNARKTALDIIYTAGAYSADSSLVHCCMAVKCGWLYGIQSTMDACATSQHQEKHLPQFVDNDFYHYDHAEHLAKVALFKPKYCTVMDIMTKEQCSIAGAQWHSYEEIMDWAEELTQYARHVIVIPKYNCLDKIPEKFILGYSVPTSHGGTPLRPESFKGRRVHLLGGSWKAQLAHLEILKDDVVSIDNNYIQKMAKYGQFTQPNGDNGTLSETLGLTNPANPMYIALAISLGNIVSKVNEMYAQEPKTVFDLFPEINNGE